MAPKTLGYSELTLDKLKRDVGEKLTARILEVIPESVAPGWFYTALIGETGRTPYDFFRSGNSAFLEAALQNLRIQIK